MRPGISSLALLPELAPDADGGDWQDMNLRGLCQELKTRTGLEFIPEQLMQLLHSLAGPLVKAKEPAGAVRCPLVAARISSVRLAARTGRIFGRSPQKRRAVAAVMLQHPARRLRRQARGVDLRVECKIGEHGRGAQSRPRSRPVLKDDLTAIDAGLLYLHDNGVLILDRGKTVFRSAMTIHMLSGGARRGFANATSSR